MPDIILEENEGETLIERRAAMAVQAAALAAVHHGNNNANANRNAANAPAAAAVPAGQGNRAAADGGRQQQQQEEGGSDSTTTAMTGTYIASQIVRLIGVDVRAVFRRLGVNAAADTKFMRERDLDAIPRISSIQKRKVWGILKFVATDHRIEPHTTLSDITRILNETKQRAKDSSATSAAASRSSTAGATNNTTAAKRKQLVIQTAATATQNSALVPVVQMVHSSKLDSFDGTHQKWIWWKNKTMYSLNQTVLGQLIRDGEEGETMAKKWPGKDQLLFNVLAEAIVDGSAKHLIAKAQTQSAARVPSVAMRQQSTGGAAASSSPKQPTTTSMPTTAAASGRILWQMLMTEYTKGHMAFRILSDARQTLQKLCLTGPDHKHEYEEEDSTFQTQSASDYVQAFRQAKETLEEYQQALPDQFLASTFAEHIQDARLEWVKTQLLQDIASKSLCLESCISELLMADHMMQIRQSPSASLPLAAGQKKRNREEQEESNNRMEHEQEDRKRLKADSVESSSGGNEDK